MASKRTSRRILVIVALGLFLAGAAVVLHRPIRDWVVQNRINRYSPFIEKHARANRLPPRLVRCVIDVESSGRADAVSSRQAKGLMQINDVTEREVLSRIARPRGDLFDPDYNILVGTTYLRQLLDRFGNSTELALAAYNMGPSRLAELRQAHPGASDHELIAQHAPPATRAYCEQILTGMRK